MIAILKEDKSSQKFYSRTCQSLAVMKSEKITECLQELELYHKMLIKDLHYLSFRDQVIFFNNYIFNSYYFVSAPKRIIHVLHKWNVPHFQRKLTSTIQS